MMTSLTDSATNIGRVERDLIVNARREALRECVHLGRHAFGDLERVGRRELLNAHADDVVVAVEARRLL